MSVGGPISPLILRAFKGLNTRAAPEARPGGMEALEARLLQNLDVTDGDLVVRKGLKRVKVAKVDGTRPIISVFRALKGSTGVRKTIIGTRNKLWTISGSATASISGSTLTLTSGNPHVMVSYQDAVYGVNGVNSFWAWTFSGKIAGAVGPTTGKYKGVFAFEEKIVHWRDTLTRSRFSWSDEGLPTTYQTLHFAFYPVDRSDELMLAWPLNGEILLSSPKQTGKTVGGLPPKAIVDIHTGIGCKSYWSAAEVGGWLYWVANGPTIVRSNNNVVQEISNDGQGGGVDLSDVDTTVERYLRGVGYKDRYYILSYNSLATGSGGTPDRHIVYDSWKSEWHGPHQGNRVEAWAEFRAPNDDGRLFGGSPSGFCALYYSGSSDAGTRITGKYQGPVFAGQDPLHRSALEEVGIKGLPVTSATVTLGYYMDRNTTLSTIGTVSLKTSGPIEGDRDSATITRTLVFGPKKTNRKQTFFEFQPEISIAQKAGRARITTFWMRMQGIEGR